jgi:hypothetical protein
MRWYREEGGIGIVVNSDAHSTTEIGRNFDIAEELLMKAEFEVVRPALQIGHRERMVTC